MTEPAHTAVLQGCARISDFLQNVSSVMLGAEFSVNEIVQVRCLELKIMLDYA